MKATYRTTSPEETIQLGQKLAAKLSGGWAVLLYGDLGAGKTHFTKGIALGLGIEETIKSPTFAYVNKYVMTNEPMSNDQLVFYHYDLYRFEQPLDSAQGLRGDDVFSIGIEETMRDEKAINVIEWADRLNFQDSIFSFHFVVIVNLAAVGEHHEISIEFKTSTRLGPDLIEDYYDKWTTPMHVRDHCKQVAAVGVRVGEAFVRAGEVVDLNLIYTAAMLHDVCRVCDFMSLDRHKFEEEVTDEKWETWTRLREENKGVHHGTIASNNLKADGYHETAEVIRLHQSVLLVDERSSYDSLEKQIVYYADKRVKHTEVVSLKERFRDGRERYGAYNSPEKEAHFNLVEKATNELERDLFADLDLEPADL